MVTRPHLYPWQDAAGSLPFIVILTVFAALGFDMDVPRIFETLQITQFPGESLVVLVVTFLAVDLAGYVYHRAAHRCHILWASHMVHHSSEAFTLISSTRQGVVDTMLCGWIFLGPLVLIGFDFVTVCALQLVLNLYTFVVHSMACGRLGPFEFLFSTPTHHHLHHAKNAPYIDRNYGQILIIWDRMFGTFVKQDDNDVPQMGLAIPVTAPHALMFEFVGFGRVIQSVRAARTLKDRFWAVFGTPEFSNRLLASAPQT